LKVVKLHINTSSERHLANDFFLHSLSTGKIAVITGSNTGIGYVTAREMARKGATVIVAARSKEKGEDAVQRIRAEIGNTPGASLVEFMQLDLSSLAQVKSFADDFNSREIPLNMLILNAGVMAPEFGLTSDGFETQIGTNHIGHFLLVKLLTPVIISSKARVVHVSSAAHMYTYPEGLRFDSFRSDVGYDPV
jgi:NAD(P)-dependent dehydrogenase (short-subunit alcohol dehydrogenase family)